MAVTRPLKEGSVTTYQAKVAAGFPDILASEVDADLDTIYAAWNGNVGTANLVDGAVTYAKLAPDAQLWRDTGTALTPGTSFATRPVACAPVNNALSWGVATVKGRLVDQGAGDIQWRVNATTSNVQDDVAKPSWGMRMGPAVDNLYVSRAPAGSSTYVGLLTVDATGNLYVTASEFFGAQGSLTSAAGSSTNFGRNYSNAPGYDNTKASWVVFLHSNDTLGVWRGAPGVGSPNTSLLSLDAAGNLTIAGATATKASGTTWANPSDRRLKDEIADYATGLAAILQLQPRTFVYNGKGGSVAGMRGYGFIADEVAPVMPETVSTRAGKLEADDEEETDIQTLDQSNLILALVNAVKELAARMDAQ